MRTAPAGMGAIESDRNSRRARPAVSRRQVEQLPGAVLEHEGRIASAQLRSVNGRRSHRPHSNIRPSRLGGQHEIRRRPGRTDAGAIWLCSA